MKRFYYVTMLVVGSKIAELGSKIMAVGMKGISGFPGGIPVARPAPEPPPSSMDD